MYKRTHIVGVIVLIAALLGAIFYLNRRNSKIPAPEVIAQPGQVKEFTMTSYYSPEAKRAYFSLTELKVNRGDRVRIKVTNTMGMHDFVIDEYGIRRDTPLNEEQVIEFVADKGGDFVYYCSRPGHRAGGQWGTLKVAGSSSATSGAQVPNGEDTIPAAVKLARTQLAQLIKVNEADVLILEVKPETWTDSCLGLGGPAESCAFVMTPGYSVRMRAAGRAYDYRTDADGLAVRQAGNEVDISISQ